MRDLPDRVRRERRLDLETLVFDNTTAAAKTVLVVVDRFSAAVSGDTYELNISVGNIPPPNQGETCAAPQVIASSGTITGQTTVGYINNIGTVSNCTSFSTSNPGVDRVYSVTVAPGQTLNATVTPDSAGSYDPSIYVVLAPAANCLATGTTCASPNTTGDDGAGGDPETTTYTNSGAAPVEVFIVVDSYTATSVTSGQGTFDLTVTLMP